MFYPIFSLFFFYHKEKEKEDSHKSYHQIVIQIILLKS
jgi:hypothetical protein